MSPAQKLQMIFNRSNKRPRPIVHIESSYDSPPLNQTKRQFGSRQGTAIKESDLEIIGQGATGTVYVLVKEGKQYAVKRNKHSTIIDTHDLLLREVAIVEKLNHPNIIKIHKINNSNSRQQIDIIMDKHASFTDSIRQLNFALIYQQFFHQALSALQYLEKQHVVHCDVKPDNFLLSKDSKLILTDFGLAMKLEKPFWTNSSRGTKNYLSPERANAQYYSFNEDMWGLASTMLAVSKIKELT